MKLKNFWSNYFIGRKDERKDYLDRICEKELKEHETWLLDRYFIELNEKERKKYLSSIKRIHGLNDGLAAGIQIFGICSLGIASIFNPFLCIPMNYLVVDTIARIRHSGNSAPKEYKKIFAIPPEGTGLIGIIRDKYVARRSRRSVAAC